MHRILLAALSLVLVYRGAASAQAQPDFSGTWKMDMARSDSAHQGVPLGSVTLTIKQTATEISIGTKSGEKTNPVIQNETLVYKLDGSESASTGNSGESIKAKAQWDGAKLVAESARSVQGSSVTTRDVLSLDASGKEMTVEKSLTVQHGYQSQAGKNTGTGKDIFVKVKAPAESK